MQVETVAAPAPARRFTWGMELDAGQRAALRDVLTALLVSRLLIWVVGVAVALAFTPDAVRLAHVDPAGWTSPFDSAALNALVAPGARFDSAWLLEVANHGYEAPGTPAFFPLYPALTAAGGWLFGSDVLAGLLLSALASVGAIYLLHRLVALDFGTDIARRTVWIVACLPTSFTLTALYTEALFLLLSVGAIHAARLGRWQLAAVAGALAATTRSAGVLLALPLLILYLWGPRADRPPDRIPGGLVPSYRLRPGVLAAAAPLLGVLGFVAFMVISRGEPLAMLDAQQLWERSFEPLTAIPPALVAAGTGLVDLVAGTHLFAHSPNPRGMGAVNLFLLGAFALSAWLAVRSIRLLPPAYTAYAFASLALPLTSPALEQPLMSIARFAMVAFPLWITAALLLDGERWRRALAVSLTLLAVSTALFAGWAVAP